MKKNRVSVGITIFAILMMVELAGQSYAVTLGKYSKGLLVPVTAHGNGLDTVIGIICSENTFVYWTFFDKDSNPVVDDQIPCTKHALIKFSLNQQAVNTEGTEGYIVFTANNRSSEIQDDNVSITGNAFLVDTVNDDAVFVPVLPLEKCDYLPEGMELGGIFSWNQDLRQMNTAALYRLVNGFQFLGPECKVDLRFWVDPDFGAATKLVIWTTTCLRFFFDTWGLADNCFYQADPDRPMVKQLMCHMDVYDEHENPFSLNIPLGCEVTEITLSSGLVVGWPNYLDGFVEIPLKDIMPVSAIGGSDGAYGFTYVTAQKGLNAAQTLLAGERCTRSNCALGL